MKRIKRLGYLGIMVCFNLVLFLTAAGLAHAVNLDLGSASGLPGNEVTIPITLNYGGGGANISATSNDIGFNPALLENPRAAIGPAGVSVNKIVINSVPSTGVFRVGVIGIQGNDPIPGGVVAYVTFKIKSGAPLGNIPLTNTATASEPDGDPAGVQGGAGTITVITVNKWSGPTAFSVKISELADPDISGNIKFKSATGDFTGKIELYYGSEGIVPNEGCYIKIVGTIMIDTEESDITICYDKIAGIVTKNVKFGTAETLYSKGMGNIKISGKGDEEEYTGIIFLDLTKATLKKDKVTNDVTSITLSGKIGGGSDGNSVFSASVKATLVKE